MVLVLLYYYYSKKKARETPQKSTKKSYGKKIREKVRKKVWEKKVRKKNYGKKGRETPSSGEKAPTRGKMTSPKKITRENSRHFNVTSGLGPVTSGHAQWSLPVAPPQMRLCPCPYTTDVIDQS